MSKKVLNITFLYPLQGLRSPLAAKQTPVLIDKHTARPSPYSFLLCSEGKAQTKGEIKQK